MRRFSTFNKYRKRKVQYGELKYGKKTPNTETIAPTDLLLGQLQHLSSTGQFSRFHKVVDLKNLEESTDVDICTEILRVYRRTQRFQTAISLHQKLRDKKVAGSTAYYNCLLESYFRLNRLPELLEEIETQAVSRDCRFYSELIRLCQRTEDTERALELFRQLRSERLEPDQVTFVSLLSVFKTKGDLEGGLALFHELEGEFGQLSLNCHTAVLALLVRKSSLEAAVAWYDKMKRTTGVDDIATRTLCGAYASVGDVNTVETFLTEDPNPVVFVHLVRALEAAGRLQELELWLKQYPEYRTDPHVIQTTFNILLHAENFELMDHIYSACYGPEVVPYRYAQESGREDADWDVHHWSLGASVACLRHGVRSLTRGESAVVVTGLGLHQRKVGARNLRTALLHHGPHWLSTQSVAEIEVTDHTQGTRGCLTVTKL